MTESAVMEDPIQGTVESTDTPGAAISTSLLYWEKEAFASLASTAATETTDAYPAGYEVRLFPSLPAAAMERMPSL